MKGGGLKDSREGALCDSGSLAGDLAEECSTAEKKIMMHDHERKSRQLTTIANHVLTLSRLLQACMHLHHDTRPGLWHAAFGFRAGFVQTWTGLTGIAQWCALRATRPLEGFGMTCSVFTASVHTVLQHQASSVSSHHAAWLHCRRFCVARLMFLDGSLFP